MQTGLHSLPFCACINPDCRPKRQAMLLNGWVGGGGGWGEVGEVRTAPIDALQGPVLSHSTLSKPAPHCLIIGTLLPVHLQPATDSAPALRTRHRCLPAAPTRYAGSAAVLMTSMTARATRSALGPGSASRRLSWLSLPRRLATRLMLTLVRHPKCPLIRTVLAYLVSCWVGSKKAVERGGCVVPLLRIVLVARAGPLPGCLRSRW